MLQRSPQRVGHSGRLSPHWLFAEHQHASLDLKGVRTHAPQRSAISLAIFRVVDLSRPAAIYPWLQAGKDREADERSRPQRRIGIVRVEARRSRRPAGQCQRARDSPSYSRMTSPSRRRQAVSSRRGWNNAARVATLSARRRPKAESHSMRFRSPASARVPPTGK